MPLIRTASMRHCNVLDALDITRKSADQLGKHFAPTWAMVRAYKAGKLSEEQYTEQYRAILSRVPDCIWQDILSRRSITLVCYCPPGEFCHRLLLADELVRRGAVYAGEVAVKKPENRSVDFG